MSAGFTPGPWGFARGVNEYGREGGPILGSITKGGTWHLAVLPSDLGPEGEANAHLIAAAPDLYEALDKVRERLDWGGHTDGQPDCPSCALHSLVCAALAKARGEQ